MMNVVFQLLWAWIWTRPLRFFFYISMEITAAGVFDVVDLLLFLSQSYLSHSDISLINNHDYLCPTWTSDTGVSIGRLESPNVFRLLASGFFSHHWVVDVFRISSRHLSFSVHPSIGDVIDHVIWIHGELAINWLVSGVLLSGKRWSDDETGDGDYDHDGDYNHDGDEYENDDDVKLVLLRFVNITGYCHWIEYLDRGNEWMNEWKDGLIDKWMNDHCMAK